jgi:hypothetical protein
MARQPPSGGIPGERITAYERLIAVEPGIERKGARMPYTSINGNMYSFLDETGALALRLSPSDRAAFMERFGATLHEAHGIVMKEYVSVPASMLDDPELLEPWFLASHAYALTLKPKATTRGSSSQRRTGPERKVP